MGDNENLTPEFKAQATELVSKLGAICREYPPAVVLFVLEAAMTEQVSMFMPPLADLFADAMAMFKERAAVLLTVAELLKGKADAIRDRASVESLIAELGAEPKPKE
jgi:hypothetical protein